MSRPGNRAKKSLERKIAARIKEQLRALNFSKLVDSFLYGTGPNKGMPQVTIGIGDQSPLVYADLHKAWMQLSDEQLELHKVFQIPASMLGHGDYFTPDRIAARKLQNTLFGRVRKEPRDATNIQQQTLKAYGDNNYKSQEGPLQ